MLPFLPCSHWSPISLVPQCNPGYTVLIGPQSHWSPSLTPSTLLFSVAPHLIAPPSRNLSYPALIGPPSYWSPNVTLVIQFPLVPHLIGPPPVTFPSLHSLVSMVPQCNPGYTVLIGSPSHWSPSLTPSTLFSLVPHLIGPPMRSWLHSFHWSPIPLVPQCDHDYTVLLVPHLIGPQSNPCYTVLIGPPSHWSPPPVTFPSLLSMVSMVPQCNPGYTVLIGSPSHWSPSLTPSTLVSLVPHLIDPQMRPWLHSSHWSPISLVPQCDHDYTVLIGPPTHWSSNATMITQFSLVPHLIGPPV